jgi:hypothetical protein
MPRRILSHISGGFVRVATAAIITAVCLIWGFSPADWFATFFRNPQEWLTSWVTRLIVVIFGVLAVIAIVWVRRPAVSPPTSKRIPFTEFRKLAAKAGWNTTPRAIAIGEKRVLHVYEAIPPSGSWTVKSLSMGGQRSLLLAVSAAAASNALRLISSLNTRAVKPASTHAQSHSSGTSLRPIVFALSVSDWAY